MARNHFDNSSRRNPITSRGGGVTPLWTAFHLYNYFWGYLANFGIFEKFEAKKPKLARGIAGLAQERCAYYVFV